MPTLIVLAFLCGQDTGLDDLLDQLSTESTLVRHEATETLVRRWKDWSRADLDKLEKAAATSDPAKLAFDEIAFRRRVPDEVWREEPRIAEIVLHYRADDVTDLVDRLMKKVELRRLSPRSVVPVLIELVDDDRPTRHEYDDPWTSRGPRPRGLGEYVRPCLLRIAGKTQLESRKSWRAWWAANRYKPEQAWYVPDLGARNESQRVVAIQRLAALRDPSLVPSLLESLKSIRDHWEVRKAINGLAPLPVDFLLPDFKGYLADRRPYIRLGAAKLLVKRFRRESIDAVVDSLEHPDSMDFTGLDRKVFMEGYETVDWLASMGDPGAHAFFLRALKSGPTDLRIRIMDKLVESEMPDTDHALLDLFDDPTIYPASGFHGADIRSPRVADMAGIFLSIRLKMPEKFVWTGPIEERDRNLAKIRERATKGK